MTGRRRRREGGNLPLLPEATTATRHLRDAREQLIPVAAIVGSVDGAAHLFDRSFRPVSDRARARLGRVLLAMRWVRLCHRSRCGSGTAVTTCSTAITGS